MKRRASTILRHTQEGSSDMYPVHGYDGHAVLQPFRVRSPRSHYPTKQVSVAFTDRNNEEQVARGESPGIGDIPLDRVTEVSYTMLTSKTSGFTPVVYTFTKTDDKARMLITLTADFLKHSGSSPDDPFAMYVRTSTKRKGSDASSKRTVTATLRHCLGWIMFYYQEAVRALSGLDSV